MTFLRDIVQGHTDDGLLPEIYLRVPRSQRRLKETFYVRRSCTGALNSTVISQACSLYNKLENKIGSQGVGPHNFS